MHQAAPDSSFLRWRASYRGVSEQFFGLVLSVVLGIGWGGLDSWIAAKPVFGGGALEQGLTSSPPLSMLLNGIGAFSFWFLWRLYSLHTLKLELALLGTGFLLKSIGWISLTNAKEPLFALVALFLSWSAALCCFLLFWKRTRIAAMLWSLPTLWAFYLLSLNLILCIR